MRRIPLRARLTLAFAAGMALVLAGLGAFLYLRLGHDLMNGIDLDLRSRAQVILGGIQRNDPSLVRSSHGKLIDPDEAFAQVLSADGSILDASRGVNARPLVGSQLLRSGTGPTFLTIPRPHDDPARLLVVPDGDRGFVVVGATTGDRHDAMQRLLIELAIAGPVALILVSLAGWFLAGAALRPVERMRREADAISLSEPTRRLPVPATDDEIARLGTTLNSMLDRLHESIQREQRFLDEASHELRTPLGVLRMELDLALARARTPEELQEALRSASAETDRLVRLAEDLLVLSRTRDGSLPVDRRETSISSLVEQLASASSARAEASSVSLETDCAEGLIARVDPDRIRQAMDGLLDNALRHGGPGGRVTVSAAQRNGSLQLLVRDTGPGFPEDVLHRAADPFARGMADRRGHGSGLGLAIVSAIAAAHGGTMVLRNAEDGGALATLELPA